MFLAMYIRHNRQQAPLSILLDTGAGSFLISLSALDLLGKLPRLSPSQVSIKSANGGQLVSRGTVALYVRPGDSKHLISKS